MKKDLKQIISAFYLAEIEDMSLLFHRISGEVSSINQSAVMLIKLAQSGFSDKEIISEISQALNISKKQISQDLETLCSELTDIKQIEEDYSDAEDMLTEDFVAGGTKITAEKTCFYKIGGLVSEISYPDLGSYDLCHSLLSAMAIQPLHKSDVIFNLVQGENGWAIYSNGQIEFAMQDQASLTDYIRTALLDIVGTQFSNWIGLHAAGVLNKSDQVLIFAAPSGAGKSTLAIELMLAGYGYLGDDTQILNLDKQEIWPFPTAANLKPGSWQLFEDRMKELNEIAVQRAEARPVKFLPVSINVDRANQPYKTKALIFPQYSESAANTITKIGLAERIKLLSESGCYSKVEASAEMSQRYIEYILSIDAYQLEYSSSKYALELLKSADLLE